MSNATVIVIRAFKIGDEWHMPRATPVIDADAAREWEAKGYCEIQDVDGKPAVWGACCDGSGHNHG